MATDEALIFEIPYGDEILLAREEVGVGHGDNVKKKKLNDSFLTLESTDMVMAV